MGIGLLDLRANFASRGFTAVALFTLTLFRRGRSIQGVTYFEDAGQRSLQCETSPQLCNLMATGQQRTRRLCQHIRTARPVDRQPERWRAANTGRDKLSTY